MKIENRSIRQSCYTVAPSMWGNIFMHLMFLTLIIMISACSGPKKHENIVEALPPPNFDSKELSYDNDPLLMEKSKAFNLAKSEGLPQDGLALEVSKIIKKCRIKDRFDRKAIFAYNWADGERLSLDVDGINMGSTKIDRVYLNYKVSLQPELEKKDHCKYASAYQGLIGSAYNELILREENTVWSELSILQAEVENTISSLVE